MNSLFANRTLLILWIPFFFSVTFVNAATSQDQFVRAYFLIRDAEEATKIGNYPEVNLKASEASTILKNLAEQSPNWDPKLVGYYLDQCHSLLSDVRAEFPSITPDSLAAPGEKLIQPMPGLREGESVQLPAELEKRIADIELEVQKRKESQLQRVQSIVDENQKLKEQAENAEKELAATRSLLSKLQNEKNISSDLIRSFQADLKKVESRLLDMASIAERRSDNLSKENEALRAQELQARRELSKAQALLEVGEQESKSPDPTATKMNEERLESLDAENLVLKQILGSIKEQLSNAKNQITPALEASKDDVANLPPILGSVALVRADENYLVVQLRSGKQVPLHAELGLYRKGEYVGSIRIVDPIKHPFASATILSGKAQLNDIVR